MCARHCVPNAHASLREIPPCGAARRSVPPPQTRSLSALVEVVAARRPDGHPSTPFLLRKTVPSSRPPAAVTVLPPPGHARIPSVERRADGTHKDPGCRTAFCRNTPSYIRDSSASRPQNDSCAVILSVSDLPTRRDRRVALTGILQLSHASRRAAAGRYSLRLSMCARHYVPNAHASLREIPPCVAARRSVPSSRHRGRLRVCNNVRRVYAA